ncbi:hypothetical protein HDU90_006126 [Geranomyces variabilis]|nr:hypothetical protein HDU90_006126 [Geranomyces variabilis]
MKISSLFLAFLPFVPASLAATANATVPAVWLAGDSTGATGGATGTSGWGPFFQQYIDESRVVFKGGARGGRSSRTFLSDGSWAAIINNTHQGDTIAIQFGHNDESPLSDNTRSRGVIRGIGEQFQDTVNGVTKKPERVYSFGHYLRIMVSEAQAKGALPVILSKTVNKKWDNTTNDVFRGDQWSTWSREVAAAAGVPFLDMRQISADYFGSLGQKGFEAVYPIDGTHFSPAGANANAKAVAEGFRCLGLEPVAGALKNIAMPAKCHDSTLNKTPANPKRATIKPATPAATQVAGHHSTGGHHKTAKPTATHVAGHHSTGGHNKTAKPTATHVKGHHSTGGQHKTAKPTATHVKDNHSTGGHHSTGGQHKTAKPTATHVKDNHSTGGHHKTANPTTTHVKGHYSTGGHHKTAKPAKPTTTASITEQVVALQKKIAAGEKLTGAESHLASQVSKWSKASRAKKAAAAAKASTLPKNN